MISTMPVSVPRAEHRSMAQFLLDHRHDPSECAVAFAAWKGFDSPLRDTRALCSCPTGGHRLWFVVDAPDPEMALGQLPPYVAHRTEAVPVTEVTIP